MLKDKITIYKILAVFLLVFLVANTSAYIELEGITKENDESKLLEGEYNLEDRISETPKVILDTTIESQPAPVLGVDLGLRPENPSKESRNISAEKVDNLCPSTKNGQLEQGCRYFVELDEDISSGNYEILGLANYKFPENSPKRKTETHEILIDREKPSVESFSPKKQANAEKGINISLKTSDRHSIISKIDTNVYENGDKLESKTSSSNSIEINFDSEEIESRQVYKVNYSLYDSLGNKNSGNWKFYTETEYEGDKNPEYYKSGVLKWPKLNGENKNQFKLNVTYEETPNSYEKFPIELKCYNSESELIDSEWQNSKEADDINKFNLSCDVPKEDYLGQKENITYETCDIAGNCIENITKSYIFDGEAPTIDGIEKPADNFRGSFKLDIEAEDRTSGVDTIKYKYDGGNSTYVSYNNSEILIKPPTSYPRKSGEYKLNIRAVDEAGLVSKKEKISVNYLEKQISGLENSGSEGKKLDVLAEDVYTIESGKKGKIAFEVQNTGETYITKANIELDSPIATKEKTLNHIAPQETKYATFTVKTNDYGEHTVRIASGNSQKSSNLYVEPSVDQISQIIDRHESNREKITEFEEKLSEFENKDISEEKIERLENNLTELKDLRNDSKEDIENTNYLNAYKNLNNFDEKSESLEESYGKVYSSYQETRYFQGLLLLLGSTLSLVVLLEAFFQASDEYDISFLDVKYYKSANEKLGSIWKKRIKPKFESTKQIMQGAKSKIMKHFPDSIEDTVKNLVQKIKSYNKDEGFEEYEY